jgi:WD40 repeat protein
MEVQVFQTETWQLLQTIKFENRVNAVQFINPHEIVFSQRGEDTVAIWNIPQARFSKKIQVQMTCSHLLVANNFLINHGSRQLDVLNLTTLKEITTKTENSVFGACARGNELITAMDDGSIVMWKIDTLERVGSIKFNDSKLNGVDFWYGTNVIVATGTGAQIWDTATSSVVCDVPIKNQALYLQRYTSTKALFLEWRDKMTIVYWQDSAKEAIPIAVPTDVGFYNPFAICKNYMLCTQEKNIQVINIDTGTQVTTSITGDFNEIYSWSQ